jgi:hypothetical protein
MEACKIMANRSFDEAAILNLLQQMTKYQANVSPYNALIIAGIDIKAWWVTLSTPETEVLVTLAHLIQDAVPIAAAPEKTFSFAGWIQSDRRSKLSVQALQMITTIKVHYSGQQGKDSTRRVGAEAKSVRKAKATVAAVMDVDGEEEGGEPVPLEGEEDDDDDVITENDIEDIVGAFSALYAEDVHGVPLESQGPPLPTVFLGGLTHEILVKRLADCWKGVDIDAFGKKAEPPKMVPSYGTATTSLDLDAIFKKFF